MSGAGIQGKVTQVRERKIGTELARDHADAETVLELEDVTELPAPGGRLSIGFGSYTYTRDDVGTDDVAELDIEDPGDLDAGTVTIDPPLSGAHEDGDAVLVSPAVFERFAFVFLEGQEEEIVARVDWSLYGTVDQLPTGTREDPEAAETVVVFREDDEYVVRDVVGEEGQALSRGYLEVETHSVVSTDPANPDVIATLFLDIPTSDARLLISPAAELSAADGTSLHLGFDDAGIDFDPEEFPLVHFYGGGYDGATVGGHNAFVGPALVAPALPPISLRSASLTLPNGFDTGNVVSEYLPTVIAPYNLDAPSVGIHAFRLTAYKGDGAGSATVANVRFWASVF